MGSLLLSVGKQLVRCECCRGRPWLCGVTILQLFKQNNEQTKIIVPCNTRASITEEDIAMFIALGQTCCPVIVACK